MTLSDAQDLIRPALAFRSGNWADIGAGTGMFTLALQSLLETGTIYALDKNPHVLYSLKSSETVTIAVEEGDFNRPLNLPQLDGMIMANALHYAPRPEEVLENILRHLRPGGIFILVEYETPKALPPWVPYPLPFRQFQQIAQAVGLSEPQLLHSVASNYGHDHIYAAGCTFGKTSG
jgi:ubiquinone/menaquinone biosynthesis C-methylase UbiE